MTSLDGLFEQDERMSSSPKDGSSSPSSKEMRMKRSAGIPNSFLTFVGDKHAPGALMTAGGSYAVPTIDM